MPHPEEKKRRLLHINDAVAASDDFLASFVDLSVDMLANILAFLSLYEIMRSRRINQKSMEAVKMTTVPSAVFSVDCVKKYNAVVVMATQLPNLQQIKLSGSGFGGGSGLKRGHKFSDGENPDEEAASTVNYTTHDIEIISNFRKLRNLDINDLYDWGLNGRYPFLFNSFPLLQKLSIRSCRRLKWDLEMLAGFPLLKELHCRSNKCLNGNINSLGVLKGTLEKVLIDSSRVEGNLMELADFPHLKKLNLIGTAVIGDIRDIGKNDFISLEQLKLPKTVYGGYSYEFQRISDAPDVVRAVYLLKKQRPALSMLGSWRGILSQSSPDWYEPAFFDANLISFSIHFVKAGQRVGYQWEVTRDRCEVNWLDPEPDRDSSEYTKYIEKLRRIELQRKAKLFKGLHQPPTEEEYDRLLEEYDDERSEGSEESDCDSCWEYSASDGEWYER